MVGTRSLTFLAALAVAAGTTARLDARQIRTLPGAQPRYSQSQSLGYDEGYQRGLRAGQEDSRRGDPFNYTDERDYRSADAGYRSQYGSRDQYRNDFRVGYQTGYRDGYQSYGYNQGYD